MTARVVQRRSGRALAAAGLAVVALVAGCGNRQAARFHGGEHRTVSVTPGPGGVERIVVDANDADRFVPDTLVVRPGKVTMVVRNTGVVPHTLEIPSLGVNTGNIGKHQTRQVSFTVRRPGTYPFDCAYHLTLHMDGTLRVVKGSAGG
jgi:plastocyanin